MMFPQLFECYRLWTTTRRDISGDDKRFLMIKVPERDVDLFVTLNWFQQLEARVGR